MVAGDVRTYCAGLDIGSAIIAPLIRTQCLAGMAVYSLGERKVTVHGEEWYIAENAAVIGSVVIANHASIWFNVVIRGDSELITVGERSNIQDGSVLHADPGAPLSIGRNVSVGHNVTLHGCTIENLCLIGMGAIILNNVRVGEGSIIAAGSLLTEGTIVPPRSLFLGAPATLHRKLGDDDLAVIRRYAANYVGYKDSYLAASKR